LEKMALFVFCLLQIRPAAGHHQAAAAQNHCVPPHSGVDPTLGGFSRKQLFVPQGSSGLNARPLPLAEMGQEGKGCRKTKGHVLHIKSTEMQTQTLHLDSKRPQAVITTPLTCHTCRSKICVDCTCVCTHVNIYIYILIPAPAEKSNSGPNDGNVGFYH
jgi:hypothetical protein